MSTDRGRIFGGAFGNDAEREIQRPSPGSRGNCDIDRHGDLPRRRVELAKGLRSDYSGERRPGRMDYDRQLSAKGGCELVSESAFEEGGLTPENEVSARGRDGLEDEEVAGRRVGRVVVPATGSDQGRQRRSENQNSSKRTPHHPLLSGAACGSIAEGLSPKRDGNGEPPRSPVGYRSPGGRLFPRGAESSAG
jgi:hypothetical protein